MCEIEERVQMISAEFSDAQHVMARDAGDLEILSRVRVVRRVQSVVRRVGRSVMRHGMRHQV